MDDDKQREIASKGGQSVPDESRSFSQDRELASEAGRKGGEARQGEDDSTGGEDVDQAWAQGADGSQTSQADADRRGEAEEGAGDPTRASDAGLEGGQTNNTSGGQP